MKSYRPIFEPAHTIFTVPEHIERVPSYLRSALKCPRVAIGCRYQPDIKITPAIYLPKRRKTTWLRRLGTTAAVIAAIAVLYSSVSALIGAGI